MADSTSFSLRSDIAAAVVKINEIKAVVDAIAETDFAALSANIVDIHAFQTHLVFASDDILLSADTERTKTGVGTTKVKEFLVSLSGVYRLSFDLKTSTEASKASGQIFRNNAAYGTLRETQSLTYVTFTQDLPFELGDYISLWLTTEIYVETCFTRNFRLFGIYSEVVAQVITD